MHKLSAGTKKALGMTILYILLPAFLIWFLVFFLKLVKFDLIDLLLVFAMLVLIVHLYNVYFRRVKKEEQIVEEGGFEEEMPVGEEQGELEEEPEEELEEAEEEFEEEKPKKKAQPKKTKK